MQGISVVICTHNGYARIGKTILSVIDQNFSKQSWELIIIDNASNDNTATFCKELLAEKAHMVQWKVVHEPKPGLNHARLKGLNTALYDIVLFCDDDNYLAVDYLSIGFGLMQSNPKIGALGGNGYPVFEKDKPEWFDGYAHSFAVGPQASQDGKLNEWPAEVYGAGCFFRVRPLKELFGSGFKTIMTDRLGKSLSSGGDVEWCYLIQLLGYQVWYDSRLRFGHFMPASRMTWEYYLRLKHGISSGSARLLTYSYLMNNPSGSRFDFSIRYGWLVVRIFVRYNWYRMQSLFASRANNSKELALVKAKGRLHSFLNNLPTALQHFSSLKALAKAKQ